MKKGLLGKKIGMTRFFADDGMSISVTVVEAGPCVITQIKNKKTDFLMENHRVLCVDWK